MQSTNDVDSQTKTMNIARIVYYHGTSCNHMKDFIKTIVIFPKVIFLLKANFGIDAANYKKYGWCHLNYAVALKSTNHLIEAKQMFAEALKIYEQASDWYNDEEKSKNISMTNCALHEVNTEIQQQLLNFSDKETQQIGPAIRRRTLTTSIKCSILSIVQLCKSVFEMFSYGKKNVV